MTGKLYCLNNNKKSKTVITFLFWEKLTAETEGESFLF